MPVEKLPDTSPQQPHQAGETPPGPEVLDEPNHDEAKSHKEIDAMLRKAAHDCQVLLAYLARQKGDSPLNQGQDRAHMIAIPAKILSGVYSTNDQVKLLEILKQLTTAADPATAESIIDSKYADNLGIRRTKNREQEWALRIVSWIGTFAFVITFSVGLYVSITETIVVDAKSAISEFKNVLSNHFDGTRIDFLKTGPGSLVVAALPSSPGEEETVVRDEEPPTTPDGVETNGSQAQKPQEQPAAAEVGASASNPKSAQGQIPSPVERPIPVAVIDPNAQVLYDTLVARAKDEIGTEIRSRVAALNFLTLGVSGPVRDQAAVGPGGVRISLFDQSIINMQAYVNKVLTAFVLPVFASIVGAVVFLLRDRGRRLESISLSSQQTAGYLPRIMVAAIAGIIIGWFTDKDSSGILSNLTPAAGAFVVGYSIEIMFNILDSIKTALGAKDTNVA